MSLSTTHGGLLMWSDVFSSILHTGHSTGLPERSIAWLKHSPQKWCSHNVSTGWSKTSLQIGQLSSSLTSSENVNLGVWSRSDNVLACAISSIFCVLFNAVSLGGSLVSVPSSPGKFWNYPYPGKKWWYPYPYAVSVFLWPATLFFICL